ncbi:MAG: hypothetical protein AAFQ45_01475 [Pseudomonadota bacterium]
MIDFGNLFIVLLALPAAAVGWVAGRIFTYWIDFKPVTWLIMLVSGFGAILPAFISWLFVEAISPASLLLPVSASVAGLGFGAVFGAWRTLDVGGWRTGSDGHRRA